MTKTNIMSALKARVKQFVAQLTQGCGALNCTSPDCRSNQQNPALAPRDALLRALALTETGASLCNEGPSNAVVTNRPLSFPSISTSTTMMEVDSKATSPTLQLAASPFLSRSGYDV